jgi:hypothetical protein
VIFVNFDVVINSKAIFDVLKKIASRSSEIRRSDPFPNKQMLTLTKDKFLVADCIKIQNGTWKI